MEVLTVTSIPDNPVFENTQTTFLTRFYVGSNSNNSYEILHNPLRIEVQYDDMSLEWGDYDDHNFKCIFNRDTYTPLPQKRRTRGAVYISLAIDGPYPGTYKIGMTQQDDIYRRAGAAGAHQHVRVRKLWYIPTLGSPRCLEKTLHRHFKGKRVPLGMEWFALDDSDLELIKSIPGGQAFERRRKLK